MNDLRKAAQMALGASDDNRLLRHHEIEALRAALDEPENNPKPVAWIKKNEQGRDIAIAQVALDSLSPEFKWISDQWKDAVPLYTHPPQRKPEQEPVAWRYDEATYGGIER